jgi:hypothetical protein
MMTSIVPRNLDEAYRLAKAVSMSGLAPKDMKQPEQVLVAILHGMEIGLKPMQAIQRIAVINGRPSLWGDAALGLVRASGLLESIKETIENDGDMRVAVCTTKRRGDPEPIVRMFSVNDAKVASLWKKTGPWTTHPDRMLQMRARGFNLRDAFPDVLGGMYLAEELQGETIDAAPAIPTPPTPPKIEPPLGGLTGAQHEAKIAAEAKLADGPNRAERGEFADKNGVEIPLGALVNFDKFQDALNTCPTPEAANAMFDVLTRNMADPNDIEEAQDRLREVMSKFPVEE